MPTYPLVAPCKAWEIVSHFSPSLTSLMHLPTLHILSPCFMERIYGGSTFISQVEVKDPFAIDLSFLVLAENASEGVNVCVLGGWWWGKMEALGAL